MRVVVAVMKVCGTVGISDGVGIRKEMHGEVKSLRNERQCCFLRQYSTAGLTT